MSSLSTAELISAILVIVLGASGTWLLLPHRHGRMKPRSAHVVGAVLAVMALGILGGQWTNPGGGLTGLFFYAFALTAVGAGVLTITSRNPVHSALWFAAVVLATSGLFLLSGAQFLAAGTIIVYAGAIIVTFLFVIMLAQREGRATYDRMARSPGRATLTCFLLFWSLLYTLMSVRHEGGKAGADDPRGDGGLVRGSRLAELHELRRRQPHLAATRQRPAGEAPINPIGDQDGAGVTRVLGRALSETGRLPESQSPVASGRHVAGLGGTLYSDHLVTVELAGALLFVALIGALAIASPKPPVRPSRTTPPPLD